MKDETFMSLLGNLSILSLAAIFVVFLVASTLICKPVLNYMEIKENENVRKEDEKINEEMEKC